MNRNLIVRCVLSSLLSASVGCTLDLNPDDLRPDEQDQDQASADEAEWPEEPARRDAGKYDAGFGDAGFDDEEYEDEPTDAFERHDAGKNVEPLDAGFPWPKDASAGHLKDGSVWPPEDDETCPIPPPGASRDAGKKPVTKDAGGPGAPPTDPDRCYGVGYASASTCISYDEAKSLVSRDCAETGYQLADLTVQDSTACMPGFGTDVSGTCCPPGPSPFGLCTIDVLGDGKTCLDPDTIKLRASAACEAIKATLTNLVIDNDVCAGGSALAEYECCELAGVADVPLTM